MEALVIGLENPSTATKAEKENSGGSASPAKASARIALSLIGNIRPAHCITPTALLLSWRKRRMW